MNYQDLTKIERKAIATDIDCTIDELSDYMESGDYLVLTDSEADEMAKEYIKESLWAFNADFILSECDLDFSGADSLRSMQEKSCESANDFILSLVEKTCGLDDFIKAAISTDGRGHFMSSYDGEEHEVIINGAYLYWYRIN